MTSLLELDGLSVSYGQGPVLRDINLRVNAGDVLGLVGESGCGKTTLGLAVLGLLPEYAKTEGRISFEGKDLLSLPRAAHRKLLGDRISTIPQSSISAS